MHKHLIVTLLVILFCKGLSAQSNWDSVLIAVTIVSTLDQKLVLAWRWEVQCRCMTLKLLWACHFKRALS